MSWYYTFAAICGTIIGLCAIALLVLESIRLHRVQVNKDLDADNRRLRAENAEMRAKHANAIYAVTVHAATISRLVKENEALEAENRALMEGVPVSKLRGMRFIQTEK